MLTVPARHAALPCCTALPACLPTTHLPPPVQITHLQIVGYDPQRGKALLLYDDGEDEWISLEAEELTWHCQLAGPSGVYPGLGRGAPGQGVGQRDTLKSSSGVCAVVLLCRRAGVPIWVQRPAGSSVRTTCLAHGLSICRAGAACWALCGGLARLRLLACRPGLLLWRGEVDISAMPWVQSHVCAVCFAARLPWPRSRNSRACAACCATTQPTLHEDHLPSPSCPASQHCPVQVVGFDSTTGRHEVAYDDGEEGPLDLRVDKVKWVLPPGAAGEGRRCGTAELVGVAAGPADGRRVSDLPHSRQACCGTLDKFPCSCAPTHPAQHAEACRFAPALCPVSGPREAGGCGGAPPCAPPAAGGRRQRPRL